LRSGEFGVDSFRAKFLRPAARATLVTGSAENNS
jgi:hypothetical protein